MAYIVNFEKATADYDLARGTEALRLYEDGQSPQIIKCDGPDGYVCELRYLIECILQGQSPVIVTAEDGLRAIKICEAEEESIKTGQPVAPSAPGCGMKERGTCEKNEMTLGPT